MVRLPSARIRRGLDAVSAGGSFELELDLIATALGNFSVGQRDDGAGIIDLGFAWDWSIRASTRLNDTRGLGKVAVLISATFFH